jgi:benzoate transport
LADVHSASPSGGLLNQLAAAPMRPVQIAAVAISVGLNALDGFDVLAITFAAPSIAAEWRISGTQLGVAISSGLAGMVAGSLLLAPIADRWGRRPIVLLCLAIMAVGMALSATAGGLYALCGWRVLAGIGIGGMVPTINAVAAEFANARRRAFCVAVMTVGYPAGGLVGGLAAAALVQEHGWRSIFVFGGLVTALFIPIAWFGLPESPDHLASQSGPRPRQALDRLLKRLRLPADIRIDARAPDVGSGGLRELLGPTYRRFALLLTAGYCLHLLVFYFYSGWLPKLMSDLGYATADAIRTSAIMSIGGVLGGAAFGWVAPQLGLGRLVTWSMIGTAVTFAIFGNLHGLVALQMVAFAAGICIFGGIVGLYSLLATSFPARLRVSGTGLAIGIGRGGAVVGPVLGGMLIDLGLRAGMIVAAIGLFSPVAALLLFYARRIRLPD